LSSITKKGEIERASRPLIILVITTNKILVFNGSTKCVQGQKEVNEKFKGRPSISYKRC
jgi:hypothetical protein